MKKLILFCTMLMVTAGIWAQAPGGMPANGSAMKAPPSIGHVYGKLVDSTGKAISDASVVLLHGRFDTATKKTKEVLLKGVSTKANGEFSFEELPIIGLLKLKISATGYQPVEQDVSFIKMPSSGTQMPAGGAPTGGKMPDFYAMGGNVTKDLGRIALKKPMCSN